MPQPDEMLLIYLHLARASSQRQQPLVRDKLLVLAGVTAAELGWDEIAADCRQTVLAHNPQHILRRWDDLETAFDAERFRSYLKQLRRKYSPEKAEHMLASLGVRLDAGDDRYLQPRDRAAGLVSELATQQMAEPASPARPRGGNGQAKAAARTADKKPRTKTVKPALAAAAGPGLRSWFPYWLGLLILAIVTIAWTVLRAAGR